MEGVGEFIAWLFAATAFTGFGCWLAWKLHRRGAWWWAFPLPAALIAAVALTVFAIGS